MNMDKVRAVYHIGNWMCYFVAGYLIVGQATSEIFSGVALFVALLIQDISQEIINVEKSESGNRDSNNT